MPISESNLDALLGCFYRAFRNGLAPIDPSKNAEVREWLRRKVDRAERSLGTANQDGDEAP
jgi:hypothetical protein